MTWVEWIVKYKKVLGASAVTVGLIILIAITVTQIDSCRTESRIEKKKQEIGNLMNTANEINANIANLEIKKVEADIAVNNAVEDLKKLEDETRNTQENTNRALDNANAVNSMDFSNTSTDDANRARCLAFPNAPECLR